MFDALSLEPNELKEIPIPLFGTKNLQEINEPQQATNSIGKENLVKLFNGKVMLESEFKLVDSIMKSEFQPRLNVSLTEAVTYASTRTQLAQPVAYQQESTPISTRTNSIEFQLNQKGIIVLSLIFCGCFVATLSLIKIWGTTDVAQQQAFQERIDNQYNQIGQRYDRLAKATEKLGKKSDVCISLFCGNSRNSDSNESQLTRSASPASDTNNSPYDMGEISSTTSINTQAEIEVRRWQKKGYSKRDALSFIEWIRRNPGNGYPDANDMLQVVNKLY